MRQFGVNNVSEYIRLMEEGKWGADSGFTLYPCRKRIGEFVCVWIRYESNKKAPRISEALGEIDSLLLAVIFNVIDVIKNIVISDA